MFCRVVHGLGRSIGWVGSNFLDFLWVGFGWVELGWVGSSWVELGRVVLMFIFKVVIITIYNIRNAFCYCIHQIKMLLP